MLNKVIDFLTAHYKDLKTRTVFLILFLVSFLIRFPFFFRDYVDRDESTFILMGQSWVNGNLPYTELWDLKPPITFLYFASIIYVFGKSFFAIRIFGAFTVAFTAFFTYKIGLEITTKKIAFWSAIACVALQSMFGSLQGVMSEHICMMFFMPGLYLLIKYNKIYIYLISGLLMGLAVMTKLNLAYAILFLGFYILYRSFLNKRCWIGFLNVATFGLGTILVILMTILPYYLKGDTDLWWRSVIEAPLQYVEARRYSIVKILPFYILILGFLFIIWKKKRIDFREQYNQILLVTLLGVLFSFLKGGRINGHYLIQLHPILILFIGIVVSQISFLKKSILKPYYILLLLLLPMESYIEYVAIVKNKVQKGTFYNGEGFSVPNYILENNIETKNILFLGYHIGYWELDLNPPTKAATHPSNICRSELFPFYENPRTTSIEELQYIMEELKPKTIITRKGRSVFDKKMIEENEYINNYLAKYYRPIEVVEKAEILQRLE
ncbi:4-amino-4-deoxy-L-arabinose transferase-like glycosyltransferase [Saonia flava]|uniref:4-amino-4-deoxy-L-arabinose transferase-like glycosyltransferase n=1 Tax=Saonia flava TaxID=523696 RepID=A0A846QYA5_9FLAO|nr:glycosyltransferase family 39 protein [Saonia flava]NJB71203.1 4-amino-4-deoxy-L-arabinose transferase-like glycosyltransferase [Saonia flava]